MTTRTFVFCDFCNSGAVRYVEQRRAHQRGDLDGRRATDGRAWIEATPESATRDHGWSVLPDGRHLCPRCASRG